MNNVPKIKIGIVGVSRDCFAADLTIRRRKALVDAYAKKYDTSEIWLLYPLNEAMRNQEIAFESNDGVKVSLFFVDVANIEDADMALLSVNETVKCFCLKLAHANNANSYYTSNWREKEIYLTFWNQLEKCIEA